MNNKQRYASLGDAYQSIYLEEGLFGKKKSAASPEELPAYKKLQTAISDRKKLGDHLNANPWQASASERKHVAREEVEVDHVIDYLLSEGFTSDEESAAVIVEHMSEEWLESILDTITKELE